MTVPFPDVPLPAPVCILNRFYCWEKRRNEVVQAELHVELGVDGTHDRVRQMLKIG